MFDDVTARLEAFVQGGMRELPFPVAPMDEAEKQCIEHVCANLRLKFDYCGEVGAASLMCFSSLSPGAVLPCIHVSVLKLTSSSCINYLSVCLSVCLSLCVFIH